MGFTFATPTVVAGTVLVVEAIQSQNYVTGVAGWYLAANGDAEVANLIARGTFTGGNPAGAHIEFNGTTHPNALALYTGETTETTPGLTQNVSATGPGSLTLEIRAPQHNATVNNSRLLLRTGGDHIARATLEADEVDLNGSISLNGAVTANSLNLGLGTTVNDLQFGSGSFTVDSVGKISIPCTLGVVPTGVFVSFQDSRFFGGPDTTASTPSSVLVYVRNVTTAGAPVLAVGTVVTCRYLFIT